MTEQGEQGQSTKTPGIVLVDTLARGAAVISGITVITAVSYNWSYFSTFDVSSIRYLSISDHVTSALEWIPGAIFYYIFSLMFPSIYSSLALNAAPERMWLSVRELPLWFRKLIYFLGVSLVAFVAFTEPPGDHAPFFIAIVAVWFGFVLVANPQRGLPPVLQPIVFVAPILIGGALVQGDLAGLKDFAATTGTTIVVTTDNQILRNTVLLRSLEKGILLRVVDRNQIVYLPWSSISQVSTMVVSADGKRN